MIRRIPRLLALAGFLACAGCVAGSSSSVAEEEEGDRPSLAAVVEVTEVWGLDLGLLPGVVYFELVVAPEAEVGSTCEIEMWSGAKSYGIRHVTLEPWAFVKGNVLEVEFQVDGSDKIWSASTRGKRLRDVVSLRIRCT